MLRAERLVDGDSMNWMLVLICLLASLSHCLLPELHRELLNCSCPWMGLPATTRDSRRAKWKIATGDAMRDVLLHLVERTSATWRFLPRLANFASRSKFRSMEQTMPTYDNLRENVGCTVVDTNRQSFLLEGADKECYIYIFQQFRQQLSNLKNSFRHQIPTYVSMLKLWFTKILDTYKCST
jgi:hypothetical protein